MRLYINKHYFISVLIEYPEVKSSVDTMITNSNEDDALSAFENTPIYNCQVMCLIHGIGMENASITDNQKDIVSSMVHSGFKRVNLITQDLKEVFAFHKECLMQLN